MSDSETSYTYEEGFYVGSGRRGSRHSHFCRLVKKPKKSKKHDDDKSDLEEPEKKTSGAKKRDYELTTSEDIQQVRADAKAAKLAKSSHRAKYELTTKEQSSSSHGAKEAPSQEAQSSSTIVPRASPKSPPSLSLVERDLQELKDFPKFCQGMRNGLFRRWAQ